MMYYALPLVTVGKFQYNSGVLHHLPVHTCKTRVITTCVFFGWSIRKTIIPLIPLSLYINLDLYQVLVISVIICTWFYPVLGLTELLIDGAYSTVCAIWILMYLISSIYLK